MRSECGYAPPTLMCGFAGEEMFRFRTLLRVFLSCGSLSKKTWLQDHKPPHELWPPDGLAPSDPLRVELVPREECDLFIHAYSDVHAKKSGGDFLRPLRILVAVNSLHEFGYPEFYWYYNTFFAGPEWLAAADYILYVSNIEWHGNEKKVDMVTKLPGLEVVMHRKSHITEWRLLRRTGSRAA